MRETLSVLLGASYRVFTIPVAELLGGGTLEADLVIAPSSVRDSPLLPPGTYLWLGDSDSAKEDVLPRRFRPAALRRWVARALAPSEDLEFTPPPIDWRLSEPFLDPDSLRIVARALRGKLSLHISGEAGSGKEVLARAVHQQRGGTLLLCDQTTAAPSAADLRIEKTTIIALDIDRWPRGVQREFAATLATKAAREVKVVSTATRDLAELVEDGDLSTEFFYRLSHLSLTLRPLRDRTDEVPQIAQVLARHICDQLQISNPSFTPEALSRLSNYLWFGNIAELESVLTRTLVLNQGHRIDASDLYFDSSAEPSPENQRIPVPTAAKPHFADEAGEDHSTAVADRPPTLRGLDILIHELAHELKNPLVTIKTFAQHSERLVADKSSDEARFARLTNEAVDDVDRVLENLLTFARMSDPNPQSIRLDALLKPLFANKPARGPAIDYNAPPALTVAVDPEQTTYAIENLIRAVGRAIETDQAMAATYYPPNGLLCQLPPGTRGATDQLSALADDECDDYTMSLGIAIAHTVLRRNGVELSICNNGEPKSVMLRFPVVENEEAVANEYGNTTSIDR